MHIDVTRLDGRFTGHPYFQHRVIARYQNLYPTQAERYMAFNEMRQWFIQSFDQSCERDIFLVLQRENSMRKVQPMLGARPEDLCEITLNSDWCWHPDPFRPCFYVTDKVLNWINIKTSNQTISLGHPAPI
jgi:hypothetical protein